MLICLPTRVRQAPQLRRPPGRGGAGGRAVGTNAGRTARACTRASRHERGHTMRTSGSVTSPRAFNIPSSPPGMMLNTLAHPTGVSMCFNVFQEVSQCVSMCFKGLSRCISVFRGSLKVFQCVSRVSQGVGRWGRDHGIPKDTTRRGEQNGRGGRGGIGTAGLATTPTPPSSLHPPFPFSPLLLPSTSYSNVFSFTPPPSALPCPAQPTLLGPEPVAHAIAVHHVIVNAVRICVLITACLGVDNRLTSKPNRN